MKGDRKQDPYFGNIRRNSALHTKTGIGLGVIEDHVNTVSTRGRGPSVTHMNIVIAYCYSALKVTARLTIHRQKLEKLPFLSLQCVQ
ncbi:MAG: hypothetical protein CM1200mP41_11110 [Gammaproteobacteria bacterium]|nr:MAG: hypothetical protein CM1200mP41_11110 [Gammaproteobacteria bacterium]